MSWWTAIFGEPADWRLCKQLDANYVITYAARYPGMDTKSPKSGCIITYYLYEDQDGNRKFDIVDSEDGDVNINTLKKTNYVYCNELYRNTIRPWLDGRLDPEIPTYESIPRRDFKRALTKK